MALPGFRIPNDSDSFDDAQQELHEADLQTLALGFNLTGVISGCAVTAQGTPDMTVAVAAGVAIVNGKAATVAAGNVTITAAHATNPRYDLVVVDDAGAKSVTAGTAAANPDKPDVPADRAVLAEVLVLAADTTIETDKIVDKRVLIRKHESAEGRGSTGGVHKYLIPGVELNTVGSNSNVVADRDYFHPFYVSSTIAVDQLAIDVTAAAAAGKVARLGIYHADENWQPTSLVVDAGTVLVDTTGAKTASVNVILDPGRYLTAVNANVSLSGYRFCRGGSRYMGLELTTPPLISVAFITRLKFRPLGQAVETGTALSLVAAKRWTLTGALETDEARPLTRLRLRLLGQAVEVDLAQPIIVRMPAPPGLRFSRLGRIYVYSAFVPSQAVAKMRRALVTSEMER